MSLTYALACFGLITISLVGFEIMFTYATQGFAFGFSSNRPDVPMSKFAIRIKRTLQNHVESAAYIVPILGAAMIVGIDGDAVRIAAALIVFGRLAYALLYYSGVPFIRVPAFVLGTLPSIYLSFLILTSGM